MEDLALLRTKRYRPPLTLDLVPRPRLLEQLNRHRRRPLTLICASAGYGKTAPASSWLQSLAEATPPVPGAWLSPHEEDNDLVYSQVACWPRCAHFTPTHAGTHWLCSRERPCPHCPSWPAACSTN